MRLEEMILKLLLAFVAGALVGIERERKDRPAGLRTHMVVAGGSTLVTLVSISLAGEDADRTRIAAQIVSGIGFLGAGTIFRSGSAVRGLTTAAGLWTVAGIGMAIAAGGPVLYAGLVTAVSVFGINRWVGRLEHRMTRNRHTLLIRSKRDSDVLATLLESFHSWRVTVQQVHWVSDEAGEETAALELVLDLGTHITPNELVSRVTQIEGVRAVHHE